MMMMFTAVMTMIWDAWWDDNDDDINLTAISDAAEHINKS